MAPQCDFTMGSAFTRIATSKNRTDRDQQPIQFGKAAQTEHGSLISMLSSSSHALAIGREETRPGNDSRLVTLVTTIDEILR